MSVTCNGIQMYDPRDTFKATAGEAIGLGESVFINSDGKAYVLDNSKADVCHGWALESVASGDVFTVITKCRMKVATTQTIGARAFVGAVAGGSAPSTTLTGIAVGFAIDADTLILQVPTPAADG